MGLTVLPPDVNASERHYTGRGRELRVGLMQLKGLRSDTLDRLLAERARGGPFASFEALRRRVAPPPSDAELLVQAGACDSIAGGRPRAELLWELYLDTGSTDAPAARRAASGVRIAAALDLFAPTTVETPRAPAYDHPTMLRHEIETLGFLLSEHPLHAHQRTARARGVIQARDLDRHAGQRVTVLGWHVTSKLAQTKHDEPMEFTTFEDTTALLDATFFPRAYERFCHLLTSTRPFLLTGRVEEHYGVCTLNVEHVERL